MRRGAFAILCVLLAGGEARAQGERAIAIASIEVAGETAPELRAQMGKAIADGLSRNGTRVVKLEEAAAAGKGDRELATCVTPSCLERLTAAIGVRELVRAHISVSGNSYEIDLELLSPTADGGLSGRLQRSCAVCTVGELVELLTGAAADLADGAGSSERAADLRVSEQPAATDIDLAAGAPEGETRPFRTWKWVAAGGAAAAVLTGVVLLLADGSGTCDGDGMECPEVYDTRTAGIVGVSLGILGGGASAWMFASDR
jgi:hypothetical protein